LPASRDSAGHRVADLAGDPGHESPHGGGILDCAPPMSRFSEPQHPLFQALNSSIAFDYRLAPYDLEQSIAHARMLHRCGIVSQEDLTEIERGLEQVRQEIDGDTFEVQSGDEDIHMAIERRLTEL